MSQALYLVYRLLLSPLESFFTLLIFILTKELDATVLQLTLLACSKPTVSLVAFKASTLLAGRPTRMKPFLVATTLLSSLPCLLFPFIENNWFYIASYAIFMVSLRSSYPILIEYLNGKEPAKGVLARVLATGSALNFVMIIFIPLIMAFFMDRYENVWKIIFFSLALLQLGNLVVLYFINTAECTTPKRPETSWKILKENPEFVSYQLLFFLGGLGLVALQPILPIYFTEKLSLSYTELAVAFSVCKGISFVFSSPFWVRFLDRTSLYSLSALYNFLSFLFVVFLLMAGWGTYWLFVAYLMYGAMQAGCELGWNISGPHFAKKQESISYSGLNHLFVGFRGVIAPFLGQFLFAFSGATGVFLFAGALSFMSVIYAVQLGRKVEVYQ